MLVPAGYLRVYWGTVKSRHKEPGTKQNISRLKGHGESVPLALSWSTGSPASIEVCSDAAEKVLEWLAKIGGGGGGGNSYSTRYLFKSVTKRPHPNSQSGHYTGVLLYCILIASFPGLPRKN